MDDSKTKSLDREIKSAVDYILAHAAMAGQMTTDALAAIVEERVRMACAETLRWQAGRLQGAAELVAQPKREGR